MQDTDIQQMTTEQIYSRGKMLYNLGNVQDMQILDESAGKGGFEAQVYGNSGRIMKVRVQMQTDPEKLLSASCTCDRFHEGGSICKHLVAAMLRYSHVQNMIASRKAHPVAKISVEIPKGIDPATLHKTSAPEMMEWTNVSDGSVVETETIRSSGRAGWKQESIFAKPAPEKHINTHPTDPRLHQLLLQNGKKRQRYFLEKGIRGQVHLYPQLNAFAEDALTLSFKIGSKRPYVLSNLAEFCDNIAGGVMKRYGKNLAFTHQLSAFDEESRQMVQFLMQSKAEKEEAQRGNYIHSYYSTANDFGKELTLRGKALDEFMQLCIKGGIDVVTDLYEDPEHYVIEEKKPLCKLYLTGSAHGIVMRTLHYPLYEGLKYHYLFRAGTIYRFPVEESTTLREVRRYLNTCGSAGIFVSREDLPMLCRDMLPQLRELYAIEEENFHAEDYLPPEVKFELYIDLEEGDVLTCRALAVYGEEKCNIFSGDSLFEKRDMEQETEAKSFIAQFFPGVDKNRQLALSAYDDDELYEFLTTGMDELSQLGIIYISDALKKAQILTSPKISAGVTMKGNLLELRVESDDLTQAQIREILSRYHRKKKFYRLKSGEFIRMEEEQTGKLIQLLDDVGVRAADMKKDGIVLPRFRALYLDGMTKEEGISEFTRDSDFRLLIRNMKSVEESEYEVPQSLRKVIRDYQKIGFRWLETLHHNGFGGILADDMGLGKTLQIIAFLKAEKNDAENRRTLIVCPASLIYNWQKEIEHFAPDLATRLIIGTAAERAQLLKEAAEDEILITSYDLLKRDITEYEEMDFFCEVIDEAQFIKNQATQAAKAVKAIRAGTRFALTGTPIENRLSELWSIFDYLMPGFLFSYQTFREELESPIVESRDEKALARLHRLIAPFVLRRLKKDVLKDLPDKMEEVVYANLEGEQKSLYQARVGAMIHALENKTESEVRESRIQILAELTHLREICCTPSLVYEEYHEEAAKVAMCMELLHRAIDGGHKVLVFSQFASMLNILTAAADQDGISYYLLRGDTPKETRMENVQSFQQGERDVFFISLKAGGTGLNLTAADIVIHFDPWWNIAAQNQATDRTHRIGQQNVVTVYQLIAKDTIEEKIIEMQQKKQALAEEVLGGENLSGGALNKEELLKLLA